MRLIQVSFLEPGTLAESSERDGVVIFLPAMWRVRLKVKCADPIERQQLARLERFVPWLGLNPLTVDELCLTIADYEQLREYVAHGAIHDPNEALIMADGLLDHIKMLIDDHE